MKSNKTKAFSLLLLSLCLLLSLVGCKRVENPVANYFKNAELQYEGKAQEENIVAALNDIISLSEEQLGTKRYKDYTGRENQWDLPTLIHRHFVPDIKGKSLGDNFYHDVKSEDVQKIIKEILEGIKHSSYTE
jgi:hypothetical protein